MTGVEAIALAEALYKALAEAYKTCGDYMGDCRADYCLWNGGLLGRQTTDKVGQRAHR